MKTGIVLEVKGNVAVVMKNGGEFMEVKAKAGWQKGDVVSLRNNVRGFEVCYAAACFIVLVLAAFGGYGLYCTETSLISVDVNPSLELSVNRFGRVISVTSYHEDAAMLLQAEEVKGFSYTRAIDTLLKSDALRPYLESGDCLDFTVYSKAGDTAMIDCLTSRVQSLIDIYPGIRVHCNSAGEAAVKSAHSHHMSIGKYLAFLELQALAPEANIDDYTHCGIGAIRNQIRRQHRNGGRHRQQGQRDYREDDSADPSSPNGAGEGNQSHGGAGP
ncbi:MAG: anti-sigma factor domain-containing protein [Firmicutes bacterium]|nr:anti-sigma factor domain-containing protein [Bacillota bacterium]